MEDRTRLLTPGRTLFVPPRLTDRVVDSGPDFVAREADGVPQGRQMGWSNAPNRRFSGRAIPDQGVK